MTTFATEIRYIAEMANQRVEESLQSLIGKELEDKIMDECLKMAKLGKMGTILGCRYSALPQYLNLKKVDISASYLRTHTDQLKSFTNKLLDKLGLSGAVSAGDSFLTINVNWSTND